MAVGFAVIGGASSPARAACPTDWNNSGAVDISDLFDFLTGWFAGDGDYDRDRTTTSEDIFAFMNAWFDASSNCGAGLSSSRDPLFSSLYVQPAIATLASASGVRTYPNDVLIVRSDGAGSLILCLWNPDIQGLSGDLGSVSDVQSVSEGPRFTMTFADTVATATHHIVTLRFSGSNGDVFVAGVSVELTSGCGNPASQDVWGILPLATAADSAGIAHLVQDTTPDYASAGPVASGENLCTLPVGPTAAGAFGDLGLAASRLGCSAFEATVIRGMAAPQAVASAMGLGQWTNGVTSFVSIAATGQQGLALFGGASGNSVVGTVTRLSVTQTGASITSLTGYVALDTGSGAVPETVTVVPTMTVARVDLDNGFFGYVVLDGGEATASTSQGCPLMCGTVLATFSTEAMATTYVERTAPAGLSPQASAVTTIMLQGDLPPGYQFPPGYEYPTVPPNQYPTTDLPTGPEGMPGHWTKPTIACFAKFNNELRIAEAKRNYAKSQCSYWNGSISVGAGICGVTGGGIGATIGAFCAGIGAVPAGAIGTGIGACIGGEGGSIAGYNTCVNAANRGYDSDRDAAIRAYLNCICGEGYCAPGVN